ncbi:MAG: hypothetical protein ACO3U5_02915 [Aquiluna sp.]
MRFKTAAAALTPGIGRYSDSLSAYRSFLAFCIRFSRETGRIALLFEIVFLDISSLIVPIYTAFMLLVLGEQLDAITSMGGGVFGLGVPVLYATAGVVAYLLFRAWLQPRINIALMADEVKVKRGLLADYAKAGRLSQVDPETFDDETKLISSLGRFFGNDSVSVAAQVIIFFIMIPLETILTGPIVVISMLMAYITLLFVLTTSDELKRAQWQLGQRSIEANSERRIWRRWLRSMIGLFPSSKLIPAMFRVMDVELMAFCERDRQLSLFDQKIELMIGLERILSLGLAAFGVVLGWFDPSQFLLILFVSGRLLSPVRKSLMIWLNSSRSIQGLQIFERILKKAPAAKAALLDDEKVLSPLNSSELKTRSTKLQLSHIPADCNLKALAEVSSRALFITADTPCFDGTLLDNLTLGNPRLNPDALRFLAWSGLQPWISSLPKGYLTALEEDQPSLPLYVRQIISCLRIFLRARTDQIVIDNRRGQLEPETISALINVLNRWKDAPPILVLAQGEIWSRLIGLQVAGLVSS